MRKRRRQMARIYYGPEGHEIECYWTVFVSDAKKGVAVDGNVAAALRAHRGVTVGCALSLNCMEAAEAFGHPVYLVSVTKSTILVVDRLAKDGSPLHAIRYGHNYGHIVERNDDGTLKKMVAEDPSLMERPFILRPPRKRPTGPHGNHARTSGSTKRSVLHLHGALARAVKAGRISTAVAEALSRVKSKRGAGTQLGGNAA